MANVTCTVVSQREGSGSYGSAAEYAGFNYNSVYYPFILKFKTGSFSGVCSSITFSLSISDGKRDNARAGKVALRYALCKSDANFSKYDKTIEAVTDSNQIVSGRKTFSGLTTSAQNQTLSISTSALSANTTYYLVLWGDSTGGYSQDYCTIMEPSGHSITLEYEAGVIYIDNGTKFEAYQVYIDNGTTWDLYIPYIDNGSGWDQCC